MNNNLPSAGIRFYVCDEGSVHISFVNEDDSVIFSIAMDIESWGRLADEIDEEIEALIGDDDDHDHDDDEDDDPAEPVLH